MADGSQVEELNALRENDHLFIFWKVQRYSANLRAASPVLSDDFICNNTKHNFQYLYIFFYAYIWIYTSSKIQSDYSTNEGKKKKKAIELTLSTVFNLCYWACLKQQKQLSEIVPSLPPRIFSSQKLSFCTSLPLPWFQKNSDQFHCRELAGNSI